MASGKRILGGGRPETPKRDKERATVSVKNLSARRERDRTRQEKHRDLVRSREGSLGLEGLLTDLDRARSRAFGDELARLATEYRGHGEGRTERARVVLFRERCLDGKTLSERQASKLLITASVYLWSVEEFARHDIPVTAHVSAAEEQPMDLLKGGEVRQSWLLKFPLDGSERKILASWTFNLRDSSSGPAPPHPRPWTDIWGRNRVAAPGSVMDELLRLARELMRVYLWSEDHALLFVLSGRAPEAAALHLSTELPERPGSDHQQMRLTLSVQPWVTTQSVARVYREFQRHLLSKHNRVVNRQPREESLQFFGFIAERLHAGRSWREMCADWNRASPEHAYPPDQVRSLQRDFRNLYKLLMGVDAPATGGKPGRPRKVTPPASRRKR